jgi:hypothetical protein
VCHIIGVPKKKDSSLLFAIACYSHSLFIELYSLSLSCACIFSVGIVLHDFRILHPCFFTMALNHIAKKETINSRVTGVSLKDSRWNKNHSMTKTPSRTPCAERFFLNKNCSLPSSTLSLSTKPNKKTTKPIQKNCCDQCFYTLYLCVRLEH